MHHEVQFIAHVLQAEIAAFGLVDGSLVSSLLHMFSHVKLNPLMVRNTSYGHSYVSLAGSTTTLATQVINH